MKVGTVWGFESKTGRGGWPRLLFFFQWKGVGFGLYGCWQAVRGKRKKGSKKKKIPGGGGRCLSGEGEEKVQLLGFLFCVPSPPKLPNDP